MRKTVWIFVIFFISIMFCKPATAESNDTADQPWERFSFKLGWYFATLDTSVRLGSERLGAGIEIDVEEALDMETSTSAFKAETLYRFGSTNRHQFSLAYLDFRRDATKRLGRDVEWQGKTYFIGTTVESSFNIKMPKATYGYAFFQDDRISISGSLGLYVMQIEAGISADGIGRTEEDITAPLPVIGLKLDLAITPKLFLKQSAEIFYFEYENFKGGLYTTNLALEYNAWKNVGFGIGYDIFKLAIEAEGEDYPEIDFFGKIEFAYTGLFIYSKIYF